MTLNITPLNVIFNQEALLALIAFATHLQFRLDEVKESSSGYRMADAGKVKDIIFEESYEKPSDQKIIPKG